MPLGPVVITDGGYEMQKAAAEWFGSVWNSLTGDSGEPPNLSTAEKGKCCCCLEEFKLTYAGSTSVQVPATKGVGNMFTLRVTTSWKPALKYKPCRMNWMEYPQTHTDGRGGSYAPSPYTAASDGEAVTPQKLPMDAWTNASDVWSEHPMFDSDLDEGGSDVSMNEALKGDGSTCPPRKTGLIVDIPAKASQGLMILYGAIQLFTGCPPQAEVKTGAEVVPGCQNVEILWWWAGSKTGPDVQSALWMSEGHDSDTGSDAPRDAPDAKGYNPPPTSEGGPEFPPRGGR